MQASSLTLLIATAAALRPTDGGARAAAIESRVQHLISQMSNEEKARQLDMYPGHMFLTNGRFNKTKADITLGSGLGIGRIHALYAADPAVANQIQKAVVESSQHGLPALFGEEGVHGYQSDGHTIFPSPISTAAAFNATLAYKIGRVIATEARITGTHEIWSPVCGLAREPRWGRMNEEFGEDVHLAATLVGQQVRGMCDDGNYSSGTAVAPLLKHLWSYSIGEGGLNQAPAHLGKREVMLRARRTGPCNTTFGSTCTSRSALSGGAGLQPPPPLPFATPRIHW